MAEAALSKTESALENQRIGGLQIRVAALCTLIQICDGYDINSVAWAVPSLTHVWNLKGFGCRPAHERSIRYKAGVRKPWKKEPVGKR
jgi:hypothetical protein